MNKRSYKGCFCAKEKKIRKSHSRGFLSGISATLQIQGGDPRLRPSGMTPLFNHGGFTLIELLVVVLIIGILAAVALPQYQKTVRKTHGAEAVLALDSLDAALSAYYLNHGTYEGASADTLDIKIPELKYLRYSAVPSSYLDGNNEFVSGQTGSAGDYNYYEVLLLTPNTESISNGTYALASWRDGKLRDAQCFNKGTGSGIYPCEDYFNCNWHTYTETPCPWCSSRTISECHLK